ncbi:MAG: hypothetical protein NW226_26390 [Microscillaceae bacterium]|nr:hypothetical protein [Microscillaceae bacterium]
MKYKVLSGLIVLVLSYQSTFSQESVQDRSEVLNNLLKSIPSPLEMSSLIKNSGIKFDGSMLNPSKNAAKYQDKYFRALNLGIFSTDLGYVNIYKNQDTLAPAYLQSIITLSNGLNINNLINFTTITQYALSNNLNGLLSETTVSFEKINQELINKQEPELSILMLTGGWLETLYLTCQVAKAHPNEVLDSRIAEQKIVLDKILPLLNSYKKGNQMNELYLELNSLNEVFKKIKIKQKNKADQNFTIEKWGDLEVVVYQGNEDDKSSIKYKSEDIENILTTSSAIRDKIVK